MSSDLLKRAAEIVESYVSNNEVSAKEVPVLLTDVYSSLMKLSGEDTSAAPKSGNVAAAPVENAAAAQASVQPAEALAPEQPSKPVPAVPVSESFRDDAVFCLICGKQCRALKGHLTRSHTLDINVYRNMFDLPRDHPLVAPEYSRRRRKLAKELGLGEKTGRKKAAASKTEAVAEKKPAAKKSTTRKTPGRKPAAKKRVPRKNAAKK